MSTNTTTPPSPPQQENLTLYDIYLEAATRLFTNMEFLSSTIEDNIRVKMDNNPQLFGDKSKQSIVQMEYDDALGMLKLYREISKRSSNLQIVQAILLYKPDSMTRNQFANFVSAAAALPLVKADTHNLTRWYDDGMPKGLYEVGNPNFFLRVERVCVDNNIPCHIVEDRKGDMKAIGVGPATIEAINQIVGNLKRL